MKKIIFFLLFFPCITLASNSLVIQHWKTKAGANVYFVPRHELPMVDVQVVFAAGSAHDGSHYGLANFTNSLMPEGANQQTANQITIAFDKVGSEFMNNVSRDDASMGFKSLTNEKYLHPTIKIFNSILVKPSFSENDFNRIKLQLLQLVKQDQQSPSKIAFNAFYHAIYGDEPYGHSVLGSAETIQHTTQKNIIDFYKKYYVKKNAKVVLVGDVTRSKAEMIADQVLAGLSEGRAAKISTPNHALKKQRVFSFYPSTQNTVVIGQVGISRNNKDYFPLMVGNHIFGGMPMSSLLFQQVRNKRGLVYSVFSQFLPMQNKGPFFITFQTRIAKASAAADLVKKLLQQYVEKGPTEAELVVAKKNLLGSFPLKIASNADIVNTVTRIAFYNLPLDYLQTYPEKIKAVTLSQVKNAFSTVIHPAQLSSVVVGKQATSTKQ